MEVEVFPLVLFLPSLVRGSSCPARVLTISILKAEGHRRSETCCPLWLQSGTSCLLSPYLQGVKGRRVLATTSCGWFKRVKIIKSYAHRRWCTKVYRRWILDTGGCCSLFGQEWMPPKSRLEMESGRPVCHCGFESNSASVGHQLHRFGHISQSLC